MNDLEKIVQKVWNRFAYSAVGSIVGSELCLNREMALRERSLKINTCLECLPCLGRNAVEAARRSTGDPAVRKAIVSESLHLLAESDLRVPPPCLARKILDLALRRTGCEELYGEEKRKSNHLAEELLKELPGIPEYDPADFESRLRLAIAGNILDFGIFADLDIRLAVQEVKSALTKELDREAVVRVRERMEKAEKILYILDNCGEAVFDRVFMEPYREKITIGVRGRAAFNDVLAGDLAGCGLENFARGVVTNGAAGIPGTVLSECGEEFRRAYREADLIIAKGQGNFETMNENAEPIAFLFLAKCPVVIREIGAEANSIQVRTINF